MTDEEKAQSLAAKKDALARNRWRGGNKQLGRRNTLTALLYGELDNDEWRKCVRAQVVKAQKGSTEAFRELADRALGKSTQQIDQHLTVDGQIEHRQTFDSTGFAGQVLDEMRRLAQEAAQAKLPTPDRLEATVLQETQSDASPAGQVICRPYPTEKTDQTGGGVEPPPSPPTISANDPIAVSVNPIGSHAVARVVRLCPACNCEMIETKKSWICDGEHGDGCGPIVMSKA